MLIATVSVIIVALTGGAAIVLGGPGGRNDRPAVSNPSNEHPNTSVGVGIVPWVPLPVHHAVAMPPLDGEPISLRLITSGPAQQGDRYPFVVQIENNGPTPVSLTPCPYYRVQYLKMVETGYLNCRAAPDEIGAGGHVDFQMEVYVQRIRHGIGGTYTLLWQLGGEGTEGMTIRREVALVPMD
jgi:hypothetical protein